MGLRLSAHLFGAGTTRWRAYLHRSARAAQTGVVDLPNDGKDDKYQISGMEERLATELEGGS